MKKIYIYIIMGILIPLSTILLILSFKAPQKDILSSSIIVNIVPDFPTKVEWGGETVDLDRFDMRERYDRELTSFCYMHSNTLLILKRANRYFPIIAPILKKNGVPEDFIYLAAIESYLNPRAVSPAKAAGLWQLMPSTAKESGLEVNDYVDERFNIERATEAACRYFKMAYAKYGSWTTAAASYNAGMGRISKELSKQQHESSFDLWLNEETSRYVFRALVLKEILNDPYRYGFAIKKHQLYHPIRMKEIMIDTSIEDLAAFAQKYDITYAQLKEFNSWLRDRSLPNKNGKVYKILIPMKDDLYYSTRQILVYNKKWTID